VYWAAKSFETGYSVLAGRRQVYADPAKAVHCIERKLKA
jgi:hypothetical protein